MAKSILTPEGDLVNYDNLIAVSVEVRPVGVDETIRKMNTVSLAQM